MHRILLVFCCFTALFLFGCLAVLPVRTDSGNVNMHVLFLVEESPLRLDKMSWLCRAWELFYTTNIRVDSLGCGVEPLFTSVFPIT